MSETLEKTKKLHIKTYGCQMNVYDSGKMADILKPLGFEIHESLEDADMVILNTCHIREKAAEKVYSELGRIRDHQLKKRKNGQDMFIAVAGCVGQAEGDQVIKRAPWVNVVVGPQSYHNLPELIKQFEQTGKAAVNLDFPIEPKFDLLPEESEPQGPSAFLSVQEGCDKMCSFCVVPYTRGAEFSRPVSSIFREALKFAAQGSKDITLLGQNVSAFHGDGLDGSPVNLGNLIREIAKIDAIKRIRYSTSHPRDMHDELYEMHANEPKLMPYLHLPVQSGSDSILQKMNRKHGAEEYLQIIEKLRKLRPDMAFSSDFIVGFPGETDQDFADTMELVRKVNFCQAYSFKYSSRPGTPASNLQEVAEDVKDARLQELQKLIREQQTSFNSSFMGKEVEILLEKQGKKENQLVGKTPFMQSVHVEHENLKIGDLVKVKITEILTNTMSGEFLENL